MSHLRWTQEVGLVTEGEAVWGSSVEPFTRVTDNILVSTFAEESTHHIWGLGGKVVAEIIQRVAEPRLLPRPQPSSQDYPGLCKWLHFILLPFSSLPRSSCGTSLLPDFPWKAQTQVVGHNDSGTIHGRTVLGQMCEIGSKGRRWQFNLLCNFPFIWCWRSDSWVVGR